MGNYNLYDNENYSSESSYQSNQPASKGFTLGSGKSFFDRNSYIHGFSSVDELSAQGYYTAIGLCLLWGFGLNYLICTLFGQQCVSIFMDHPIMLVIGYFIFCITGTIMFQKSDNPVISFVGYNLIVLPIGVILSSLLYIYKFSYGPGLISTAFLTTAMISLVMILAGIMYPKVFESIASTLVMTIFAVIIIEVVLSLFGMNLGFIDYVVAVIFSLYIGVDMARAQSNSFTLDHAIDSAAELYLDIINIFIRVLSIMARHSDN